jgi:hypothetical protein
MFADAMLVPRGLVNDEGLLLLLLDDGLTLHCEEKVVGGTRTERMSFFVSFLRGGWFLGSLRWLRGPDDDDGGL